MKALYRLFCILLFGLSVNAEARLPESKGERSLLYWRYLCRGQIQREFIEHHIRELSCPFQGWKVRAPETEGKVSEVLFDGT